MPTVVNIPLDLQEVLGEKGSKAFVEVLSQFETAQRNAYERTLELHLQVLKEFIDRRFDLADEKNNLRRQEARQYTEMALQNAKQYTDQRISQAESKMEAKIAQAQTALIKWMFTFYVGTVITITGLLIAYLQFALKP